MALAPALGYIYRSLMALGDTGRLITVIMAPSSKAGVSIIIRDGLGMSTNVQGRVAVLRVRDAIANLSHVTM